MAGGEGACQPARKTLQAGACGGKDRGRASRPFPPLPLMAYTYGRFPFLSEDVMSGLNLAATTKEEQDKVAIDLVASGVVCKERLSMARKRRQPCWM